MTSITRRRYTDDFKSQTVDLAESAGRTPAARQLGISIKSLDNWIRLARDSKPRSSPERKLVSEQESEMARLRVENAELRMEGGVAQVAKFERGVVSS